MGDNMTMVDQALDPRDSSEIIATLKVCTAILNAMIRGIEKGVGSATLILQTVEEIQSALDTVFDEVVLRTGISQTDLLQ